MGGSLQEPPGELTVTANSRMSASTLLSKLFDDLKCDAERENFHRLCENYIRQAGRPVLAASSLGRGSSLGEDSSSPATPQRPSFCIHCDAVCPPGSVLGTCRAPSLTAALCDGLLLKSS